MIERNTLHKRHCILIIVLFITSLLSAVDKPIFKKVRLIGDDREDYIFRQITGIAINNQKEIFVSDGKQVNIRKYNWEGKCLAKAGQTGKGPGDFIFINEVQWLNNKLFISDPYNRRIAVTDAGMKRFDYIKIDRLHFKLGGAFPFRDPPIALDENRFVGMSMLYNPEEGRIAIFDKNQEILHRFFCHLPADIANMKECREFVLLAHPYMAVNHHKKQIIVSFHFPDTDIPFNLYDYSGQLIRTFTYTQDKKYSFPIDSLDDLKFSQSHITEIWDILAYKDYYMVFLQNMIDWDKSRSEMKSEFYFLFFRENGEFIHKMEWKVRFITISEDGYLGGITQKDDEYMVAIYKFDPEALEAVALKKNQ